MNAIIPIPPRIKMIDVIIIPTLNPLSPNRSYSKRRKLNPLSRCPVISNIHFHLRMAPIRSKVPRAIIIKPPFTGVMLLKKIRFFIHIHFSSISCCFSFHNCTIGNVWQRAAFRWLSRLLSTKFYNDYNFIVCPFKVIPSVKTCFKDSLILLST